MRSINFVIICFLLNNFFIVYASDLEVFMDEKSVQVNTQTFEIDSSTENRKKKSPSQVQFVVLFCILV